MMRVFRGLGYGLLAGILVWLAMLVGATLAYKADAAVIHLGERCWDTEARKLGWTTATGCDVRRPWEHCWEAHLAYATGTFRADQYPAHLVNGTICERPWWVR